MQLMNVFQAALVPGLPCASFDTELARFFHDGPGQLNNTFLQILSEPGSSFGIASVLVALIAICVLKKHWHALLAVLLTVPGMGLGELIKIIVQRARPFPHVEHGYSFPSGHTISVTLLYGTIALLLIPLFNAKRWRALAASLTAMIIVLVGFSRIALGAHYLTDVLAALCLGTLWLAASHKLIRPLKSRLHPSAVEAQP